MDNLELHHEIGLRIRNEREKQGVSQTQLAKMVGKTRPMISNIEGGRTKISIELLYAIARALDVPVYVLTGETEEEYEKYATEEKITSLEFLLETIHANEWHVDGEHLPEENKKALEEHIKAIIAQRKYELTQKKRQSKDQRKKK